MPNLAAAPGRHGRATGAVEPSRTGPLEIRPWCWHVARPSHSDYVCLQTDVREAEAANLIDGAIANHADQDAVGDNLDLAATDLGRAGFDLHNVADDFGIRRRG